MPNVVLANNEIELAEKVKNFKPLNQEQLDELSTDELDAHKRLVELHNAYIMRHDIENMEYVRIMCPDGSLHGVGSEVWRDTFGDDDESIAKNNDNDLDRKVYNAIFKGKNSIAQIANYIRRDKKSVSFAVSNLLSDGTIVMEGNKIALPKE